MQDGFLHRLDGLRSESQFGELRLQLGHLRSGVFGRAAQFQRGIGQPLQLVGIGPDDRSEVSIGLLKIADLLNAVIEGAKQTANRHPRRRDFQEGFLDTSGVVTNIGSVIADSLLLPVDLIGCFPDLPDQLLPTAPRTLHGAQCLELQSQQPNAGPHLVQRSGLCGVLPDIRLYFPRILPKVRLEFCDGLVVLDDLVFRLDHHAVELLLCNLPLFETLSVLFKVLFELLRLVGKRIDRVLRFAHLFDQIGIFDRDLDNLVDRVLCHTSLYGFSCYSFFMLTQRSVARVIPRCRSSSEIGSSDAIRPHFPPRNSGPPEAVTEKMHIRPSCATIRRLFR